jgi:glucose-6-phosphate isomerase
MSQQIRIYYKNCTAGIIGNEDGISESQLKKIAEESLPIIREVNKERKAGKTAYRELPSNNQMVKEVKELASELRDNCENFVVLGIGGSALGNIALQTALNPYMYNMDDAARKGPRLFVFDNVDPCQFGSFLDWVGERIEGTIFNVISKSGQTLCGRYCWRDSARMV